MRNLMDFDFSMLSDEEFARATMAMWQEQLRRWESAGDDDNDE